MVTAEGEIFKVELVNANTGESFKQHIASDGEIYVEVEPNMEYFVKVSASDDPKERKITADIEIDGKKLWYRTYLWTMKNNTAHLGYSSMENGKHCDLSLKFAKVSNSGQQSFDCIPQLLMGQIVVSFREVQDPSPKKKKKERNTSYEYDEPYSGGSESEEKDSETSESEEEDSDSSGSEEDTNFEYFLYESSLKEGNVKVSGKALESKLGCVQNKFDGLPSVPGTNSRVKRYSTGKLVRKMKLNYCTALGLIEIGILPKPPLWDFHRLQFPQEKSNSSSCSSEIQPEKKRKITTTHLDGKSIVEVQEFDFFDLTKEKEK
uniref:Uncharacterized protein n=1 Tax=Corethron hystrix TaxID=216773 RepID=A0A6U5L181_9STRA|mmetsp:Transcript_42957/g.100844  ORF Transcript_42957/g.100844 Transcript_42957/m.100844 type:complete len:320 (+) Transcript_42957:249-1208(+)